MSLGNTASFEPAKTLGNTASFEPAMTLGNTQVKSKQINFIGTDVVHKEFAKYTSTRFLHFFIVHCWRIQITICAYKINWRIQS